MMCCGSWRGVLARVAIVVVLGAAASAEAKECGGNVACACGDSVRGSATLTADLVGCTAGLRVKSNAVLDCAGHAILAAPLDAQEGVVVEGTAATVRDCTVAGFGTGIRVRGGGANVIADNDVVDSARYGLELAVQTTHNRISGNLVTGSGDEGVHVGSGADDNVIEGNDIEDEETGVWIGSRMAENQFFMDCSEPAYVSAFLLRIHRDHAARNVVRGNRFSRVTYGVRVEDDGARVEGNLFLANDPAARAVLVGSKWRTIVLGAPVAGVVIESNDAALIGVAAPYRWIHGHADTAFAGNRAFDAAAGAFGAASLVEGEQPPIDPFLFAIDFWRP